MQHADQDVTFQQVALTAMEKLKESKELNMENYAFLYDRVQCNLNYKQRFGTQVIWIQNGEASGFRPIEKEYKVNRRRKKIGLQPLALYALSYGFNYKAVNKKKSRVFDANHRAQVQQLIDGSKDAYRRRDFQKTYDNYNQASTYAGGMTNSENLHAAITFAEIAALTHEEQYKGIALDFLALLHLRKTLRLRELKKAEFNILNTQHRWIEIYSQLNNRTEQNK